MLRLPTAIVLTLLIGANATARAQAADQGTPPAPAMTILTHDTDTRWWLSGQVNVIGQWHGDFDSPYQGENSLLPHAEHAVSRVWTIDGGFRLMQHVDVWADIESAGGRGISDALGLAGFTNLDVVRNPSLGTAPYLARLMLHVTIPIGSSGGETTSTGRQPWTFGTSVPARRIEIRGGKMSLADFFDTNSVGSDSHLQFTNWTVDNNGAWDYAADTRGYTYAVLVEFDEPRWSIRAAEALMPTVANGITLDWNVGRAGGTNVEGTFRPTPQLTLRLLAYRNRANMGRYQDAIDAYRDGTDPRPDIEAHRQQGRVKYGVGLNGEYAVRHVRFFGRMGANEGENESFAYTEVNSTFAAGGDVDGERWRRGTDRVGVAIVTNGISAAHQEYLRLGGLGFLLGDGSLNAGREVIVEGYYTAHVWRGVSASADVQHIENPGYNRDRGPALVGGLRLHLDF